jgi:hypothetical protein
MPSRKLDGRIGLALAVLAIAFAQAGCLGHKVQASAPVAAAPQPDAERPMSVAPDTNALPPKPAEAPSPAPAIATSSSPPPLGSIAKPKNPPAPPKPATEQPAASEPAADPSAHPPVPLISPQLSAADQQNYERKMNDDVGAAEKNLQQANGRQLSAGQQDLVEKIHSFLDQARDASKGGDWARAQNLAQKARLLSTELVDSL